MKDTNEITRDVLRRRDEWQRSRRERRRGLTRTVAVLVLVLTLCGGVAAAGGNALADFFMGYRGGALSQEQAGVAALAQESGTCTAVSGDWTVTVGNAISDGRNYYLTMSVTGPEGWMEDVGMVDWHTVELFADGKAHSWNTKHLWHEFDLAEGDTDYYVMCLNIEEPIEGPVTMELRDMLLCGKETTERQKLEESWVFAELKFAVAGEPVTLMAEPVTVLTGSVLDEGTCMVQLDAVELRTFSLRVSYSHMDRATIPDLEGVLVLKDGAAYELHFSGGADHVSGTLEAVFGFPVIPEEVDHILLEGIRLDIP